MSDIIITQGSEILWSSKEIEDEDYIFNLEDMRIYDFYEYSVRTILDDLANKLEGPTVARLLLIFSRKFLDLNNLDHFISDEELSKIHE